MKDVIIYASIDSTNAEAHRLLLQGKVNSGTLLIATFQSEGKGQFGRLWQSEPGKHLAMTLILHPAMEKAADLPGINMRISLAVVRTLQAHFPALQPRIKWPNDIYLDHKKLCGLLIENTLSGPRIQTIIIGIGMNVNEKSFPPSIPNAISLRQSTGEEHDLTAIALSLREHIQKILSHPEPDWKNEYDQYLFGKGEIFPFDHEGNEIKAAVIGVDQEGKLVLRTSEEDISSYYSHEIKWIL